MPQISSNSFIKPSNALEWMIWEITEELTFFQTFPKNWLPSSTSENINSQKNLESTAARFCLWQMCQPISDGLWNLKKDGRNRPYFEGSNFHISLSHSFPYVAAVISQQKSVGIDLERYGRNVEKIGPRFLASKEWDLWKDSHADLTRAWACKEAIYKAMGVPGLSFQQDIRLPHLSSNPLEIQVRDKTLSIVSEEFEHFVCSIAIEN